MQNKYLPPIWSDRAGLPKITPWVFKYLYTGVSDLEIGNVHILWK